MGSAMATKVPLERRNRESGKALEKVYQESWWCGVGGSVGGMG